MAAGTDIKKETIETISSYIFNFPMAEGRKTSLSRFHFSGDKS